MRFIPVILSALLAAVPALAAAPPAATHPGGASVTVKEVALDGDAVVLATVLANEGDRPVRLNQASGAALVDARGGRYALIPPAGNRELTVSPGSRLDIALRFQGPLDPAGGALRLVLNETAGSATDPDTETPRLTVALQRPEQAAVQRPAAARTASGTGGDAAAMERLRDALGARQTAEGLLITLGGDVLFDFGKADIQPAAEPTLRQLAELIGMTAPKTVIVTGHTDSVGSDSANIDLSLKRAVAVGIWLEKVGGVRGPEIEKRGYGEKMAVAWNRHKDGRDNPEGRRQNRRVEVTLVAAGDPPGTQ